MPKIDVAAVPVISHSGYPAPYAEAVAGRSYQRLADVAGLKDFAANLCRLAPGAWSSQRHWHSEEDEFVMMVAGEAMLITDVGETLMRPGDCAAFKAGVTDAHHLVNRSDADALFLAVGPDKPSDSCTYPDIDMHLPRNDGGYTHTDGRPY
ncbi:cupin domain-containing protein [Sphingoaurantiacus capsulatus]|uniref:Cupin domain-containing protein n=1 Tax=Sphingoaurantiacus capsulatus TaxID=1771310 RepID=A0ABV7X9X8_9SPHN